MIAKIWRGEVRLWKVFWVGGFLFALASKFGFAFMEGAERTPGWHDSGLGRIASFAFSILLAAAFIFLLTAIWRNAKNSTSFQTKLGLPFWGVLARGCVVAFAVFFVYSLVVALFGGGR